MNALPPTHADTTNKTVFTHPSPLFRSVDCCQLPTAYESRHTGRSTPKAGEAGKEQCASLPQHTACFHHNTLPSSSYRSDAHTSPTSCAYSSLHRAGALRPSLQMRQALTANLATKAHWPALTQIHTTRAGRRTHEHMLSLTSSRGRRISHHCAQDWKHMNMHTLDWHASSVDVTVRTAKVR